jgi:RNase adaptor protein for sRNA GlmZ degradation
MEINASGQGGYRVSIINVIISIIIIPTQISTIITIWIMIVIIINNNTTITIIITLGCVGGHHRE